jgi:Cu/Ag efflux protein CusF
MHAIHNSVATFLAAAAIATTAAAQMPMKDGMSKDKMGDLKMMSSVADSSMADGEVRKVDKDSGTVTLKHGPIRAGTVEMDPMTMSFPVKDKAVLDSIKAGDKVKFRVVEDGGRVIVTEIKPAAK